jgi:acyl-CoA synthetase (AMP-forming)/AMP-acid ligase II
MFFERNHLLSFGERPALLREDGTALSYRDLVERVDALRARFDAGRGLLLLRAPQDERTIVALLAGFQGGIPVMPVAPGHAEEEAGLLANFPFRYLYDPATDRLDTDAEARGLEPHPDLCLVLSSSGSTGAAKSIRLSHRNIASNAEAIAAYLGLTPEDRAPTNLPLHYSYGLSVLNSHLQAGGALMLTARTLLDAAFWEAFDRCRCTSFAAVPHVIDMLEKSPFRTADRPHLRYATQAGGKLAPARVAEIARRSASEGWRFFVMYGQTEASPRIAYLPPEKAAENPDCIGIPIPDGTLSLIDEDGVGITGIGQRGELVYSGPNVMMGYATEAADMARGAEVERLHTGDMAERTEAGFFRIVGRKSRFIKPFGLRVSLDEVDAWLSAHGHGAVAGAGREERLWLLTLPGTDPAALMTAVAGWLNIPQTAIRAAPIAERPLNPNGKSDGRAVARIIAEAETEQEAAGQEDPGQGTPGGDWGDRLLARLGPARRGRGAGQAVGDDALAAVFRSHFPGREVTPGSSFTSLQGDSLRFLGVALDLEKRLGELPEGWDRMPIRALAQAGTGRQPSHVETSTFLRCLAIMLIVSGHLGLMRYGGGGSLTLLALAGFSFAAYQLPAILGTGSVRGILSTFLRVAVPAVGYLTLLSLTLFPFDIRVLLLISNWIDPHLAENAAAWFIDIYLQILLVMAAVLALRPVRRTIAAVPFWALFGFAVLTLALSVGSQQIWDAHELYRRLPHLMIWLFALGMVAQAARGAGDRILVTALAVVALALWFVDGWNSILRFATFAICLLIWVPRIELPGWAVGPVRRIAGASLFIYLTHFQFATVARYAVGDEPILLVISALAGGVVVWSVYEWGLRLVLAAWNLPLVRLRDRTAG